MTIDKLPPDPAAASPAAPVTPVRKELRKHAEPDIDTSVDGEDSVEISDEARARANSEHSDIPAGLLAPDRLVELRRRIQQRAHDDPAIVDQIMRRLAEQGEI